MDLIGAYRAYFSDAFETLVNDRDEVTKNLELVLDDGFVESLVRDNGLDLAFWAQVCDLRVIPSMSAEDIAAVRSGLQMLRDAFAEKLRNPLSIVTFGEAEIAISTAYAIVDSYNSEIRAAGEEIDKVKLDARAADLPKAQQLLARWVAFSERLSEPVKSAAEKFASAEIRKIEIAGEKKTAQEALTSYAGQTMKARQSEINNLLSSFGANFSIANVNANFKGREPNTDYAITIGDVSVGVGEKSDAEPSFGTLLGHVDKLLTQRRAATI